MLKLHSMDIKNYLCTYKPDYKSPKYTMKIFIIFYWNIDITHEKFSNNFIFATFRVV